MYTEFLVDINLEGVEFSTLPSGLHLVSQDVVYVAIHLFHCDSNASFLSPDILRITVIVVYVFFYDARRPRKVTAAFDFHP